MTDRVHTIALMAATLYTADSSDVEGCAAEATALYREVEARVRLEYGTTSKPLVTHDLSLDVDDAA